MNDEFRGHSPLPNDEELAWMSVEPFAAIRRVAVLMTLAFVVAMALVPEPVSPVEPAAERFSRGTGAQPELRKPTTDLDAHGGVLAASGWIPVATGMTLSALRPLG